MKEQNVITVNDKVKDTFFKTVYASEKRRKSLASYLLSLDAEQVEIKNVKPVIFGNKENDLAFLCDDVFYCMMEEQSSMCINMPYRILEYITTALRSMVDSEQALYGSSRVMFPFPKLYVTFVGLEEHETKLPKSVKYDMKLSDSYKTLPDTCVSNIEKDLEVVVHAFDFRMTYRETLEYIEKEILPERFSGYPIDLRDYALFCNSLRYVQRAENEIKYPFPVNIKETNEIFILLKQRGIFVDLLSDREVCNMTAAQFSREDIIKYAGVNEGIEMGVEMGVENGLEALVNTLKSIVGDDFKKIADAVRQNEIYANVSDEEIRKFLK